ncbi:hypothetical protein I546_0530 [Mycobacterium kansasii 732]|nr:hypothetical protein I546_0530 [Mycobacterium kansasii 732]
MGSHPLAGRTGQSGTGSVDPAHAVNGNFFNQGLGDEFDVGVSLVVHVDAFRPGPRQCEVVPVTLIARIWHRVPKWKGGV